MPLSGAQGFASVRGVGCGNWFLPLRLVMSVAVFQSCTRLALGRWLCCFALIAAGLLLAGGCRGKEQGSGSVPSAQAERLPADAWFSLNVGDKPVRVQLALSPQEQARGLMGREALGADDGMLFVFDAGKQQSFWMHNTPLPLDIGYFDNDGILREIYPLYPFDRTAVRSRRSDIRYVLEMPQGWFARSGIRAGAQLDLQALAAAVGRRR